MRFAILTLVNVLLPAVPAVSVSAQVDSDRWNLTVQWPQGPAAVRFLLERGDPMQATWTGPQGTLAVYRPRLVDSVLTFVLRVEDQTGDTLELTFRGTIRSDTLLGHLETPRGTRIPVAGRRGGVGALPAPVPAKREVPIDSELSPGL